MFANMQDFEGIVIMEGQGEQIMRSIVTTSPFKEKQSTALHRISDIICSKLMSV